MDEGRLRAGAGIVGLTYTCGAIYYNFDNRQQYQLIRPMRYSYLLFYLLRTSAIGLNLASMKETVYLGSISLLFFVR